MRRNNELIVTYLPNVNETTLACCSEKPRMIVSNVNVMIISVRREV